MERTKLEEFSHWWINRKVDPKLALTFKRKVYYDAEQLIDKRFVIALTGLRRTRKTTIIKAS